MRGADEIIREVLRSGPKKPTELLQACKEQGLKGQTYYRHLRRMIKLGEIKDAKYELIMELEEADPEEVADCLKNLKSSPHEDVRIIRAKDLVLLCRHFRLALMPDVLNFFETSLNDPCEEVREQLVYALNELIEVERKRKPIDENILQRIIDKNIETVRKLALEDSSAEVRNKVMDFFSLAGDRRGLDPIFQMIKNCDDQVYAKTKTDLAAALLWNRSYLFKKCKREIRNRLDELLADPNEKIRNRAKELFNKRREFH